MYILSLKEIPLFKFVIIKSSFYFTFCSLYCKNVLLQAQLKVKKYIYCFDFSSPEHNMLMVDYCDGLVSTFT